jgi:hypothetical protein
VGGKVWWDEKMELPKRKPRRVKGKNMAREGLRRVGRRRAWGGVVARSWIPDGFPIFLTFSFFVCRSLFYNWSKQISRGGDVGPGVGPSKERSGRHA